MFLPASVCLFCVCPSVTNISQELSEHIKILFSGMVPRTRGRTDLVLVAWDPIQDGQLTTRSVQNTFWAITLYLIQYHEIVIMQIF